MTYATFFVDVDTREHGSITNVLRRSVSGLRELPGVAVLDQAAWVAHAPPLGSPAVSVRRRVVKKPLESLRRKWSAETEFSSLLAAKRAHPAFTAIVALGDDAIPVILESLAVQPDFLFMALHEITRQNPVAAAHQGRLSETVQDW